MAIKWIKDIENNGNATLTNNYVMTSKVFSDKFNNCYSAVIGVDDDKNVVIKPLTLDENESPLYQDVLKVKVSIQKSYMRFGNTKAINQIKSLLDLNIPKKGIKGITSWDNLDNYLVINLKGDE